MHDPDLDKLELDLIAENTPKSEIALYLADPDLAVTEKEARKDDAPELIDHHEDTYLHGSLKQIYVVMNNEQYVEIMAVIDKIKAQTKLETHTDIFLEVVRFYEKTALK